jgi:hypothetical protein
MKPKLKTVEEFIREKAEREELKQLRQLKKNLESGIVFDCSPELMNILLTYKTFEL